MLANVKVYKGIEFIELNDLPPDQAAFFKAFAPKEIFIKILIKERIVADCIQYKDYKRWYHQHYNIRKDSSVTRLEQDLAAKDAEANLKTLT